MKTKIYFHEKDGGHIISSCDSFGFINYNKEFYCDLCDRYIKDKKELICFVLNDFLDEINK